MANMFKELYSLIENTLRLRGINVDKANNFLIFASVNARLKFFEFKDTLSNFISFSELEVYLFCLEAKAYGFSKTNPFRTRKDIQRYVQKKHLGTKYNGVEVPPEIKSELARFCKRENAFWSNSNSPINNLLKEGLLVKEKNELSPVSPLDIDLKLFILQLKSYIYSSNQIEFEGYSSEDAKLYESYLFDQTNKKNIEQQIDAKTINFLNDSGINIDVLNDSITKWRELNEKSEQ